MRMSKESQLAVTVLMEVGLYEHEGPVSLAAIQSRHDISTTRLEQVFSKLRRSQLVDSTRGPGGGYCLAVASEKISLLDIVLCVDPADPEVHSAIEPSVADRLWLQLNQKIQQELQSISLRQLLSAQRQQDAQRSRSEVHSRGLRAVKPSSPDIPWWPVPSVMSAS